uniref:Uncharacterized protein n=1 Tax=Sander lucioperca TaxID=283035 RepID=A0A8C9Z7N9_SANLU
MPRGKGYRRSLAGKLKYTKRNTPQLPTPEVILVPRCGTGLRHRVKEWTRSKVTGKQHKFIIPPEVPDKKFILIVGDSHLRAIADGVVPMPKSQDIPLSFGFMSAPGGTAADLRAELDNALLPRIPDAICLLAPSNNLTANQTISEAAADFRKLVFVVDFPPRLNIDLDVQRHYREEYHRVAAPLGIRCYPVDERFPLNNLKLWSKDGKFNNPILVHSLFMASYLQVFVSKPNQVPMVRRRVPQRSSPWVAASQPSEDGWTVVRLGSKVIKCLLIYFFSNLILGNKMCNPNYRRRHGSRLSMFSDVCLPAAGLGFRFRALPRGVGGDWRGWLGPRHNCLQF